MAERVFTVEAVMTSPTGLRVRVVLDVPESQVWRDVAECAEIAQMGAAQVARMIDKHSDRKPFQPCTEVPF